jgi:hypothetical protein
MRATYAVRFEYALRCRGPEIQKETPSTTESSNSGSWFPSLMSGAWHFLSPVTTKPSALHHRTAQPAHGIGRGRGRVKIMGLIIMRRTA